MNKTILIGIVAVVIIGILGFVFINGGNNSITPPNIENGGSAAQNGSGQEQGEIAEGYEGRVLAGTASKFFEFKKGDYDKALSENKIIVLDFYANWCPICRAEEPEIFAGFEELNNENVIGFRVNFKDSDTDEDETDLANQFNIPYQHTKIVVKNGQEVSRHPNQWDRQDFLDAVNSAL